MITFETTAEFKAAVAEALREELCLNVYTLNNQCAGGLCVEVDIWFGNEKIASAKDNVWIPQGE